MKRKKERERENGYLCAQVDSTFSIIFKSVKGKDHLIHQSTKNERNYSFEFHTFGWSSDRLLLVQNQMDIIYQLMYQ